MKHVSELNHVGSEPARQAPVDEVAEEIIDELFVVLAEHVPGMNYDFKKTTEMGRKKLEWAKSLALGGIVTVEKIKIGVTKLRTGQFTYIMSPGQFIALCSVTPEDLGLPSVDEAFQEAALKSHPSNNEPCSHITIRNARNRVGTWELTNSTKAKMIDKFEKAYLAECQDFSNDRNMNQITEEAPKKGPSGAVEGRIQRRIERDGTKNMSAKNALKSMMNKLKT